jgi:hypothetical protein
MGNPGKKSLGKSLKYGMDILGMFKNSVLEHSLPDFVSH